MIEEFSESEQRFLMQLIFAYNNAVKGNLNSLMLIYECYDKPVNKSPSEVMGTQINQQYIETLKLIHAKECVIEYYKHNILVNTDLFWVYMEEIDFENCNNNDMFYRFSNVENMYQFLNEILYEVNEDESKDYTDLPF